MSFKFRSFLAWTIVAFLILAFSRSCHNKPFFLSCYFKNERTPKILILGIFYVEKWTGLDKSWIKLLIKGGDRLALFG
ncbi:MAG: hypothetical protein BGO39_01070 [Chloroflexi bacterium 54-19]|nr:MAG: hypothetical protein BGO39_01070 [Chloroflexi bacterium 54-19]